MLHVQITHELIERLDGHLKAAQYYSVIANMRGTSPEEVAARLMAVDGLTGLQVIYQLSHVVTCSAACYLLPQCHFKSMGVMSGGRGHKRTFRGCCPAGAHHQQCVHAQRRPQRGALLLRRHHLRHQEEAVQVRKE